ncbi:MAG: acetylxylan esterase [Paludibacteraceae bacterium]|nr:acetylxylan esterase [Paludibacteraceae bacterium]
MTKRLSILLIAFASIVMAACGGCKPNTPPDDPTPQTVDSSEVAGQPDMSLVKSSIPVTDDWIFSGKPSITFHIENANKAKVKVGAKMKIVTDDWQDVITVTDSLEVAGNSTQDFVLTTPDNLAPGFYRATCAINGKGVRSQFVFGIDPFQIVSAPDKQADFDEFWNTAKQQLAGIDMNVNMIELTAKSTDKRKVYLVEMQSVPDGLTGDPVTIRGYYCEPQDGQPHPVIMHFFGYDEQNAKGKLDCPSGGYTDEFAEFYLSHRGQYINNRKASQREPDGLGDLTNIYGDWFAYHFGDKNSYYYRGAYLDCVQAVNFMATRPTSDMQHLFAEGSSQGGALCYAAAALSDYPFTAIAPNVAFMGDFPDYFRIVSWPASTAKANQGNMTDAEMYAFLSYFDTKNIATRISAAVLATSGLQDGTCPPHTNIAPFNNLLTAPADKEYHFYPEMQHAYPVGWNGMILKFFRKYL